MPVTLRRHLFTAKVKDADGKTRRVVKFGGAKGAILAGRALRAETGKTVIKSSSSPVERAFAGAKASQRAFELRSKIRSRKELGTDFSIIDMNKYAEVVEKQYANDEAKAVAAWVKGSNLGGSVKPAKEVFDTILRRRFGAAFAAEVGKAGAGRKPVKFTNVVFDNLTHSALVEPVVERLTRGLPNHFQITRLVEENKGILLNFVPQANGRYRAQMSYEGKAMGDVTKNFKECMLPSLKKYLDA